MAHFIFTGRSRQMGCFLWMKAWALLARLERSSGPLRVGWVMPTFALIWGKTFEGNIAATLLIGAWGEVVPKLQPLEENKAKGCKIGMLLLILFNKASIVTVSNIAIVVNSFYCKAPTCS
jgi:hypothetical protein